MRHQVINWVVDNFNLQLISPSIGPGGMAGADREMVEVIKGGSSDLHPETRRNVGALGKSQGFGGSGQRHESHKHLIGA